MDVPFPPMLTNENQFKVPGAVSPIVTVQLYDPSLFAEQLLDVGSIVSGDTVICRVGPDVGEGEGVGDGVGEGVGDGVGDGEGVGVGVGGGGHVTVTLKEFDPVQK